MKRITSFWWIKDLIFYVIFVLLAWVALTRIYQVGFLEALTQFLSEYGLIVLLIDVLILAVGILGSLYIDKINNHPPQNFSQQQAIQRHKVVDTWMGLVPGPAFLFGAAGVVFLVFMGGEHDRAGSLLAILFTSMVLFGVTLTDLGKLYMVYLRKRSTPTVEEVLSGGQPPVLYLRSFIDDDTAEKLISVGATEEEEVSRAFQDLGPLIAIGQPGERLPDLGAARAYFDDSEWQDAVRHYMDIASLVVLRAGFTQGLLWEIRNAVQHLNPQRFVLLIPYTRKDYDRFREQVGDYFPKGLPDHSGHKEHFITEDQEGGKTPWKFGTLFGLVHFDADWTSHFEALRLKEMPLAGGNRVYTMMHSALRPVYQKMDRTWQAEPQDKFSLKKITGYGCIVLVLGAACLLAAFAS